MEVVIYVLVLAGAIATLFFAVAFREAPRVNNSDNE
ncbi:MAG: photosystem II reaction center protein T [Cyanobacteria bacterium QS_8_64_29]|nr:MAG: photosystem II reaction center protein T [Cyanobacteria bacterium QS_8_64_29]